MPDRHYYRVFDLCVEISIELPGCPKARPGRASADILATVLPPARAGKQDLEWLHQWRDSGGAVTLAVARHGDGYLLRAPGQADFRIRGSLEKIDILPAAACDDHALAHLLFDQVLPRVLSQKGELVIHASGVVFPGGQAVAFLGNTGRGKSTLASSLCRSGCALLSDDCLLIGQSEALVSATPAYPGLRLWPDALAALFPVTLPGAAFRLASGKVRLATEAGRQATGKTRLAALFLLADAGAAETPVSITPMQGHQAVMALVESAFVLDLTCRRVVRRNLSAAGRIAQSGLPMFELRYRRDFALLPQVRAALESTLGALAANPANP